MTKLGLLAYSTQTGLGYQTKGIYDNLRPEKTLVVDLSEYNQMPTNHKAWYPDAKIIKGIPDNDAIKWLVDAVDTIFICETPLNYNLFHFAKERGVKVIQQPNPEFFDYFRHPNLSKPTVWALPTSWKKNEIAELDLGVQIRYLPVPIDRKKLPQREIDHVTTIGHIIGRPAIHDRNGTIPFLKAAKKLREEGYKFRYVIYLQPPIDAKARLYFEPVQNYINLMTDELDLEIVESVKTPFELYEKMDLLVLPRRYGGLCLPMLEAVGSNIPVIMPDIPPNRDHLPKDWLCKIESKQTFFAHTDVDYYEINVNNLAQIIKDVSADVVDHVDYAKYLSENLSWEKFRSIYEKIIK